MKFLVLNSHDPYLNLAVEEYLFRNSDDDIFMLWQNDKTVVIGKNQNVYAEINEDFLKEEGITVARRITGGGAVYHDLGNLNYTFISSSRDKGIDFEYFTEPILEALRALGISPTLSGRNDLEVSGLKFSGNAQYNDGKRVLHHGTLLFDSDLTVLSKALSVDEEKLKAKAIKSTRSRVTNLRPLIDRELTVEDFIAIISDFVIKKYSPEIISPPENAEIERLQRRNSKKEWIYPDRDYLSGYTVRRKKKFFFGLLEVFLDMSNDIVKRAKISGDFFGERDITELEKLMEGKALKKLDFSSDLLEKYIYGITADEFLSFLTD